MSNPSGPADQDEPATQDTSAETEIIDPAAVAGAVRDSATPERRFTAPSAMDAGSTQIIAATPEPETEIFAGPSGGTAGPQVIPGRNPVRYRRSWGWVIAVVLVIAALAAVAILGTVLLTRDRTAASQEDRVRTTIQNFDTAIQTGDLSTLRTLTCGETADSYIRYDDTQWADIHARVSAARQYPVVASIDQVVVHDQHAEANVTTFMAYDPSTRSTRSFDLEFRDQQWKICQAPQ
jgi:hypothetical protein